MWITQVCLTCGGICPPFFSQVSLGVGDPDARQYNLKVSPSWTPVFWGLTWTWGCVPRPLGLDSDREKKKKKSSVLYLLFFFCDMIKRSLTVAQIEQDRKVINRLSYCTGHHPRPSKTVAAKPQSVLTWARVCYGLWTKLLICERNNMSFCEMFLFF